jgi:hypothetical protein
MTAVDANAVSDRSPLAPYRDKSLCWRFLLDARAVGLQEDDHVIQHRAPKRFTVSTVTRRT